MDPMDFSHHLNSVKHCPPLACLHRDVFLSASPPNDFWLNIHTRCMRLQVV